MTHPAWLLSVTTAPHVVLPMAVPLSTAANALHHDRDRAWLTPNR